MGDLKVREPGIVGRQLLKDDPPYAWQRLEIAFANATGRRIVFEAKHFVSVGRGVQTHDHPVCLVAGAVSVIGGEGDGMRGVGQAER